MRSLQLTKKMSAKLIRRSGDAGKLLLAFVCLLALASPAAAVKIAWVTFHPGDNQPSAAAATLGGLPAFTTAPDKGYTDLLAANGHQVTRYLTTDTPDTNFLNTFDLVIVGRSVDSGNFELDAETRAWNSNIYKPMMLMSGYTIRNVRLGLTNGGTIPDTAGPINLSVTAEGLSSGIFSGIPLDGTNTMVNPFTTALPTLPFQQNGVNTVQRGISVNTDSVAGNGQVLATVGTGADPAFGGMIIGHWSPDSDTSTTPDPGDRLAGHRVVFLSGSREHDGTAPNPATSTQIAGLIDLTPNGRQLFLNTVAYTAALPSSPLGDADGNGVVNGADYAIIRDHFNLPATSKSEGDVNFDGVVNFADFRLWKNNRTAAGSGAGFDGDLLAAVPEPAGVTSLVLAAVTIAASIGRRRGRQ